MIMFHVNLPGVYFPKKEPSGCQLLALLGWAPGASSGGGVLAEE